MSYMEDLDRREIEKIFKKYSLDSPELLEDICKYIKNIRENCSDWGW